LDRVVVGHRRAAQAHASGVAREGQLGVALAHQIAFTVQVAVVRVAASALAWLGATERQAHEQAARGSSATETARRGGRKKRHAHPRGFTSRKTWRCPRAPLLGGWNNGRGTLTAQS